MWLISPSTQQLATATRDTRTHSVTFWSIFVKLPQSSFWSQLTTRLLLPSYSSATRHNSSRSPNHLVLSSLSINQWQNIGQAPVAVSRSSLVRYYALSSTNVTARHPNDALFGCRIDVTSFFMIDQSASSKDATITATGRFMRYHYEDRCTASSISSPTSRYCCYTLFAPQGSEL